MTDLKIIIEKLEKSGKIERLYQYFEVLLFCYQNRDFLFIDYFKKYNLAFKELIAFDKSPEEGIKTNHAKIIHLAFEFIKHSNSQNLFDEYFDFYLEHEAYIEEIVSKAGIYQNLGYFFWLKQDIEKSLRYLTDSLFLINSTDNYDIIPGRYTNIGFIYESVGDLESAEKYYIDGLNFAKNKNSLSALKLAYAAIGRLMLNKQNMSLAEEYFKEALLLYSKDENDSDKTAITTNLAFILIKKKSFKNAIKLLKEQNTLWLKENNPELYFSVLENLGICYIESEKYEKAIAYISQTLEFARKFNVVQYIISSCINLGSAFEKLNNFSKAQSFYNEALKYEELNEFQRQDIYHCLAILYHDNNKYKKAISYYKKALNLYKKNKNLISTIRVLRSLSDCCENNGELQNSLEYLKESWKLQEVYNLEQKKKDEELESKTLYLSGTGGQYIFKHSNSLISRELTQKIGVPVIGRSSLLLNSIEEALLASKNDKVNILLKGETGTGKELFARLIHFASARNDKPFIETNSAIFSSGLIESTLFGHEKGAFTGAGTRHTGLIKSADKGTLFLDEIGDMPLEIQAIFLRVLETKSFKPLGSNELVKVDFRLISATHHNLKQRIDENLFRFDLLNRINTIEIQLPALRDRKEDIPLIIEFLLAQISQRLQRKKPSLSLIALDKLINYDYPGNIRELYNIMERLVLFCKNDVISPDEISLDNKVCEDRESTILRNCFNLEKNEEELILQVLKKTNYQQAEAAKLLGITRYSLLRRLKKYNIR